MHGAVIRNPKTREVLGYSPGGYDLTPSHPGIEPPVIPEGCEIVELAEDWDHPGAAWKYDWDSNTLVLDEELQATFERDSITEQLTNAYIEAAGLDKAEKAGLDCKARRASNNQLVKALTDRLAELKRVSADRVAELK